jgi:nitroreductase
MSDHEIMSINEAIERRHAIRSYTERPIADEAAKELRDLIDAHNRASGLSMRLFLDEPQAFSSVIGRIGFKNARNYLALIGKNDDSELDEKCGYHGEQVVLRATQLGLGSCWVAMGFRKTAISLTPGEKLRLIVALGYGAVEGKDHRSKPLEELYAVEGATAGAAGATGVAGAAEDAGNAMPAWFERGIKAAQLAPTARNQQKFRFVLTGDTVRAEDTGGILSRVDLGIVKCHFELAAAPETFTWATR